MQVSFEVPEDVAHQIAPDAPSLSRVALEAFTLEAIRSNLLTIAQARQLLGIRTRYQMDGFLKEHGVFLSTTLEDVHRDTEVALAFSKE